MSLGSCEFAKRLNCMFVRLSSWSHLAPIWRIFIKFNISVFFRKSVDKIQASLKSHKNDQYITWISMYICDSISLNSSWNEKCFRQKLYRNKNTHSIFNNYFPESRAVCEIMWKKYGRARQATDDNIIRRMRISCWIPMATNTHSQYVIFMGFPR
jgi:hypothetical protein